MALAKQEAMRRAMLVAYDALQQADSIYEAKDIRLSFELFHEMARLAKNVELQNIAVEMRLRAPSAERVSSSSRWIGSGRRIA